MENDTEETYSLANKEIHQVINSTKDINKIFENNEKTISANDCALIHKKLDNIEKSIEEIIKILEIDEKK